MTDNTAKVREHYRATDLTNKIKSVLATTVAEGETPSVVQLARLDRFHTRGILATAELASAAPALKNGMENIHRESSHIQLTPHVFPPSNEKDCSNRDDLGEMLSET